MRWTLPIPRTARRALAAVLIFGVVLCAVLGVGPWGVGAARAADGEHRGPVVVIGMTGVRWQDADLLATPGLWQLSRDASLAVNAVRSVRPSACPADGWLALSAGRRAADLPAEVFGECRTLRPADSAGRVPRWEDYLTSAAGAGYDAQLGLLGETVRAGGLTAHAFGPGAAIALADATGTVVGEATALPRDHARLATLLQQALRTADLVVLDAGTVRETGRATVPEFTAADSPSDDQTDPGDADPDPGEETDGLGDSGDGVPSLEPPSDVPPTGDAVADEPREEQVQRVDGRVRTALAAIRTAAPDATVLVASIADSGTAPRLQLAAALGPAPAGSYGESLLVSGSTRQVGIIQTTDITPTVLELLGLRDRVRPGALVGALVNPVDGPPAAHDRLHAVIDHDDHAQSVRPITPGFFTRLIAVNLALYLTVALALNGRVLGRVTGWLGRTFHLSGWRRNDARSRRPLRRPARLLHTLRVLATLVAALPVSSFLANLSPWWRAPSPAWAMYGLTAGWMVVITAVALAPRWRRTVLAPLGVVAGTTAAVIAYDVLTGSRMQLASVMGVQPVVAGRWYGLNNGAFALFGSSAILTCVAVTDPLVRRGRRWAAAGVIALVGLVVMVIDGTPGLGSDFGGPPALVPAFAVLGLLALGVRVTWWRVLGLFLAGLTAVTALAVLDWLRPPSERTHLGAFIETVLDGGLLSVITRKLGQNLTILTGSWLVLLAVGGVLLVVGVLARPTRWVFRPDRDGPYDWLAAGSAPRTLGEDAPMLRAGTVALGVLLAIGFAINDSGIVIPAIGCAVAVPLLAVAVMSWLLHLRAGPAPAADAARAEALPDRART